MTEVWSRLCEGRSNLFLFAVLPTVVVTLAYVLGAVVALVIERLPSLGRYRLHRPSTRSEWLRCLGQVLRGKVLAEIPLTFAAYPAFVWLGLAKGTPLPGALAVVGFLAAAFVVEDAWHYFAHRTLHTRWAFEHIHAVHHQFRDTFAVAANHAHPLETVFTGFGTVLPVLLLRPHLSTMLLWIALRQWQAMGVHLGFELPLRLGRIFPIFGGARFHDRHHHRYNRNFAPTFVWLDRLLGTEERAVANAPEAALSATTQESGPA